MGSRSSPKAVAKKRTAGLQDQTVETSTTSKVDTVTDVLSKVAMIWSAGVKGWWAERWKANGELLRSWANVTGVPVQMLEEKDRKNQTTKDQLRREQRFLKRRLCNLDGAYGEERRSASESGSSSRSSASETDEVDIMGFNTNQSDSDDHSSIQSVTSDGGVAISTKRLCLAEGV
ncbi:max dimerization protein 1 [Ixodes scapularis]